MSFSRVAAVAFVGLAKKGVAGFVKLTIKSPKSKHQKSPNKVKSPKYKTSKKPLPAQAGKQTLKTKKYDKQTKQDKKGTGKNDRRERQDDGLYNISYSSRTILEACFEVVNYY